MINELYTLVNNATRSTGVVGCDLTDPAYRPGNMDAVPAGILRILISESEQAKQYWLTLVRSVFVDERFWAEPMSYFDSRLGYAMVDIRRELDLYRKVRFDVGLKIETSKLFWRATDFALARWSVLIEDTAATITLLQGSNPAKTVEFNAAGVASFPLDDDLVISVYRRGTSGYLTWATSPTDTLQARMHRLQSEEVGNIRYLATAPTRFPKPVVSGLLDLALCTIDVPRAAGALLLLVGGHLAAINDAKV